MRRDDRLTRSKGVHALADYFECIPLRLRRHFGELAHVRQRRLEGAAGKFGAVFQRRLVLRVIDRPLHRILQDFALAAHEILPAFKGDAVGFGERLDILAFALDNRGEIDAGDLELLKHFGEIEGRRLAACAAGLRPLLMFFGHRFSPGLAQTDQPEPFYCLNLQKGG